LRQEGRGEDKIGHIRNEPEKSLASRFAVLQGEEQKKRSPEEEHVLNIQLAVFIDRFFTSTEVAKKGDILKC